MAENAKGGMMWLTPAQEDCVVKEVQSFYASFQAVCPPTLRVVCQGVKPVFGKNYENVEAVSASLHMLNWTGEAHRL